MTVSTNGHPLPSATSRLFSGFTPATSENWRRAAGALLKGKPFEKTLFTRTPEGIELAPIYHASDASAPSTTQEFPGFGFRRRGQRASGYGTQSWLVSQEAPFSTPEEFNAAARHDLAHGQTELNVLLDLATLAGRDPDEAEVGEVGACGLSLATLEDMDRAFAGIKLPEVSVYLRAGASALPAAAFLIALAKKRSVPLSALRGCIEIDPLGMLAWNGILPVSLDLAWREMAAVTSFAVREAPRLQTIAVQSHIYRDAGAHAVQELAFALATGIEYLRTLQLHDIAVADAAPRMRFACSVGSNFFMEIAKFRAARMVWAHAVQALGGGAEAQKMHLHVRTSTHNKTVCDPLVNLLRSTTEALAAVVGGCQSLHVGPFDEVVRVPDEFSRRLARNTHAILAEECELTQVTDPAGGSYYIESLTDQIAGAAWGLFQTIEAHGGMKQALTSGFIQEQVAQTAQQRAAAVASRRTKIIGTNKYAYFGEQLLDASLPDYGAIREKRARHIAAFRTHFSTQADTEILASLSQLLGSSPAEAVAAAVDAATLGATLGEICRTLRAGDEPVTSVPRIQVHRAAQPFERLRDLSDCLAERTGQRPLVLQANIGPSRTYRRRADWTTSFLEVGGFQVAADTDFNDAAGIKAAIVDSGAHIVVITSGDETYATMVESLARELKAHNPGLLLLVAGNPGEHEQTWRKAGVDEFLNLGTNALEFLTRLLDYSGT